MPSTNLKTIWLTIRATNYTTQVFTNVISNMSSLEAAEKKAINSSLNLGKSSMAAGILFSVMGNQIGGTAGQLLNYASYGMYAVSAMSYLKAATMFLNAQLVAHNIILELTITNWQALGIAIMAAIGAFLLVVYITQTFGKAAGMVTGLAIAIIGLTIALIAFKAIATWGASTALDLGLMAGIGMAAGGIGGMIYAGSHAMGTRMAGVTGPAMIHKGEVIYNPATGRPTQVGNDLANKGGSLTTIDASMHIDTLNTKASEEELSEIIRKQGRKIANDRR